jgi:hypothetical protein
MRGVAIVVNRTTEERKRRARLGLARVRSSAGALAVLLALIVQLLVVPNHQARLATAPAPSDFAAIAADLKATFGDAAALCVEADDKGGPGAPTHSCDDECPLCRLAGEAGMLVPDAPEVPSRLIIISGTLSAAPEIAAFLAREGEPHQARAPPLTV